MQNRTLITFVSMSLFCIQPEAGVIYSQDFSSDPKWMTDPNQVDNFYWDSHTGLYIARTETTPPGYVPNRYGYSTANLDTSQSFRLEWDQSIINQSGRSTRMYFGLTTDDFTFQSHTPTYGTKYIPQSTVNIGVGSRDVLQLGLQLPNGDNLGWTRVSSSNPGTNLGQWYTFGIEYDSTAGSITSTITDRETQQLLFSNERSMTGVFSPDMVNLAVGAMPYGYSHTRDTSTMYQVTAIDNIVLEGSSISTSPPTGEVPTSLTPIHDIRLSTFIATNTEVVGEIIQDTSLGFDPTAPTYVVTHGWQRDSEYSDPDWDFAKKSRPKALNDTLEAMEARFLKEKFDVNGNLIKANIILAEWEGAYTGGSIFAGEDGTMPKDGAQLARMNADYAGILLGKGLADTLGNEYSQDLHFIGHSYGTIVNGLATKYLDDVEWFNGKKQTVQFTALDAPTDRDFFAPNFNADWFTENLSSYVDYLDNYYGDGIGAYGEVLPGSSISQYVNYSHSPVWDSFYTDLIVNGKDADTNPLGRDNGDFSHRFDDWMTPTLGTIPEDLKSFKTGSFGTEEKLWDTSDVLFQNLLNAEATKVETFTFVEHGGLLRRIIAGEVYAENAVLYSFDGVELKEKSPVAFSQTINIPTDAKLLTFDWLIGAGGDGDWFSLFFDDTLIWNMGIDATLEGIMLSALIDISNFNGLTGDLVFSLNSVGTSNAELYIGELSILTRSSAVPEPVTLALMGLGLAGIGWVRHKAA